VVSGQQPGESDRDYFRRLTAEANNQKRASKDAETQRSLDAQAREQRVREALQSQDEEWVDELSSLLGDDFAQAKIDIERYKIHTPGLDAALSDINAAQSKWTAAGRAKAGKKAVRKHKNTLKKTKKEIQKNKGCVVWAVVIVGALAGAVYGSYEGVTAIVGALGQ
jgi:hypothetical protein